MTRPRVSDFPLHKPFENLPPRNAMQEIVFPLIVNFNTEHAFIVGTATILTRHLLMTAKHVLQAALENLPHGSISGNNVNGRLSAVQVLPDGQYQLWDIVNCWPHLSSDIVVMQTENLPWHSGDSPNTQWKQPIIRTTAPAVGEKIAALGYVKGVVATKLNSDGGWHHDITNDHIASIGVVREIHEPIRDSVLLPFPCYRTSARFDSGMSGGPLFDETGAVCGLVCASVEGASEDGENISYASSLWPLFNLVITASRGPGFSPTDSFPLIDLAQRKIIGVTDLDELQRRLPPWP